MSKVKSRPSNNFHCFEGRGLKFWEAIAKGMRPSGFSNSPDGYQMEMARDIDGAVVQNGGMFAPQHTKLTAGTYFRFYGSITRNKYGDDNAVSGGWWIDLDTYATVCDWAETHDISIAKAAQQLLVIPNEWHDCGYVAKGLLLREMKAWVGKGKPATGTVSPDSAMRGRIPVSMSPAHLEIKQYFVPGDRALLSRCFQRLSSLQVTSKGLGRPLV